MIHLRMLCPAALCPTVTGMLEADAAVINLVVIESAGIRPSGDLIRCDVRRRDANRVVASLEAAGVADTGSLLVETVDAVVGQRTRPSGSFRARFREHEPVWALIDARVAEGASYPPSWFSLMAIAGVIGAVGLLTNSQILIVGAMVVGPEYGAILAMAWGTTKRDWRTIGDALLALVAGFSLAIAAAVAVGCAIQGLGDTPPAYAAGIRPVSQLIDAPNICSFTVAVVAGVVGVVSLTTARASTMIGVFISVTTIPAAADMGLAASYGDWGEVRGSVLQLGMNVVVLTLVGVVVLLIQRQTWAAVHRHATVVAA